MAAENPGGQENDRLEKLEDAVDRNSPDPQRKKEQPHDRIQNESQQRQRPANDQEQDPKEKCGHSAIHTSADAGRFHSVRLRRANVSTTSRSYSESIEILPPPTLTRTIGPGSDRPGTVVWSGYPSGKITNDPTKMAESRSRRKAMGRR